MTQARPMRVLHIGKFYPPHRGGMETHLQALVEGMQNEVDVTVLVANDGRATVDEEIGRVRVCRLATWAQIAATSICPDLAARIRKTPADIVHIHWPNPAAILAWLVSGHSGRLVVTYHSDVIRQRWLSRLFAPALNAALARADAIIATSPNYIEASEVLSRWRRKCHVLPFGIADEVFRPADANAVADVQSRFRGPIVMSVGRLVYYKGFAHLIRAMAGVAGTLLIVGDGPLREPLQKLIDDLGMRDRAFLLRDITDTQLRAYYSAADLFVLPSIARSEAFGLVQVEAMAAGTPVINTWLASGVPYVSQHGITGGTVPPADEESLRNMINTLLNDDALRARYSCAARARADAEFRASHMVARTLALYRSLTEHAHSAVA